jgi:hypothetical protein
MQNLITAGSSIVGIIVLILWVVGAAFTNMQKEKQRKEQAARNPKKSRPPQQQQQRSRQGQSQQKGAHTYESRRTQMARDLGIPEEILPSKPPEVLVPKQLRQKPPEQRKVRKPTAPQVKKPAPVVFKAPVPKLTAQEQIRVAKAKPGAKRIKHAFGFSDDPVVNAIICNEVLMTPRQRSAIRSTRRY